MDNEITPKRRVGRPSKADRYKEKQQHLETGWGGAREGSGRKSKRSVEGNKLSHTIAFRVTEKTRNQIAALRARGLDPYAPMVEAVEQMCVSLGIEIED